MRASQRSFFRFLWLLSCGLALAVSGCQSESDVSTFVQDFARQVLAAFLL